MKLSNLRLSDEVSTQNETQSEISGKQDTLISGTNLKTINSNSLLGSGDLVVGGGTFDGDMDDIPDGTTYVKTENNYDDAAVSKLGGIEAGATKYPDTGEGAFTDAEKTKLSGIAEGAEVNNISDANATDLTDTGETTLHTHAVEGTAIKSTGESGGTKFLRENGDGTSSWQTPAGGHTQNTDTGTTGNTFTVDSDSTIGKIIVDVALGAADLSLTLTNETLTSTSKTATFPNKTGTVAMTSDIPVKANGTEVDTGTDDAKFITSAALLASAYLNPDEISKLTAIDSTYFDAANQYLILYDVNDGLLKRTTLQSLREYFDTIYTPL